MASFFEKLKKGMGIEESAEKEVEEPIEKPIKKKITKKVRKTKIEEPIRQVKKIEIKTVPVAKEAEKEIEEVEKPKVEDEEVREDKEKWAAFGGEPEGQLAIDVYQTKNDLVIQSAIAGVRPGSVDISMEKDIITIKGSREKPFAEEGDYFSQECYWGPFSREVILPAEVDPNRAVAEMKEGILTIRIPKMLREKKRKITVKNI